MTSDLSGTTRLEPGQSLRMAVDAGASLLVVAGRVHVVSPPSWFGDTPFSSTCSLDEGELYVAERGGWIEVAALTPVRLRGVPQAAPAPAASSRVTRLWQLLAG